MNGARRPLLVFGGEGQLGRALQDRARHCGWPIVSFSRQQADITNTSALARACDRLSPAAVINAAAFTAVDAAETSAEQAFAVNASGAENVAAAARSWGVPLLHVSTDYVFDGAAVRPYREEDPVNPLGTYGESKLAGERRVLSVNEKALVLRTSCVYGLNGSNFVKSILSAARSAGELSVVDDQTGCPTLDTDLADALLVIVSGLTESAPVPEDRILHLCGAEAVTRYEWARAIVAAAEPHLGSTTEVRPTSTRLSSGQASRPTNSALCSERARSLYGVEIPGWRAALPGYIRRYFDPLQAGQLAKEAAA